LKATNFQTGGLKKERTFCIICKVITLVKKNSEVTRKLDNVPTASCSFRWVVFRDFSVYEGPARH
jgi:hypothetical protein